ncbi:MAG: methyltransferase domain-containing protein [Gammaproteobacteria bacterium]|jgi:SAM-dependent methyltransferase
MYLPKNWQQFRNWLKTDLGRYVLEQEAKSLPKILKNLFGSNILILGEPEFGTIISYLQEQYKNINQFILHPVLQVNQSSSDLLIAARQDKLPICSDSMDVVILPHSLEMVVNPHEVLRESYRVLRPEGKIIIIGFSPYSFWRIWKLFAKMFFKSPWRNAFISPARLFDWLTILGMEELFINKYCHVLPINNNKILSKLLFLEVIGKALPFRTGNIYTICACKRVVALTPIFVSEWAEESLNDDLAKSI